MAPDPFGQGGLVWLMPAVIVVFLVAAIVQTILSERPTDANTNRLARRLSASARRTNRSAPDLARRKGSVQRPAALVLGGFGIASLVLAVFLTGRHVRELGEHWPVVGLPIDLMMVLASMGLIAVAWAYYAWAPLLLERVRIVLESEAASTNEPPPMPRAGFR